jgi:predicted nucleotidyltransferase
MIDTSRNKSDKANFFKIFNEGAIYIFGSRVDVSLKGGDIDLYIQVKNQENILEKKIKFLARLKEKIGDQKIDVIVSKDSSRVIEQEALKNGIKL